MISLKKAGNIGDLSGIHEHRIGYTEFTQSCAVAAGSFTAPLGSVAAQDSASRLHMSRRQRRAPKRKTVSPARRQAAAVIDKRERLVAEIASIRKLGHGSELTVKAERLLTRWWARANWEARERLISAAEWLVRLEYNRGVHP